MNDVGCFKISFLLTRYLKKEHTIALKLNDQSPHPPPPTSLPPSLLANDVSKLFYSRESLIFHLIFQII
jgi:hypothetical protein